MTIHIVCDLTQHLYHRRIDTLLQHFNVLTERFEGERFALGTLLGVARLVSPQVLVMLEATTMD